MENDNKKDLVREIKNAYHRQWQKRNPEKVKKAQERYWKKRMERQIQLREGDNYENS